MRHPPLTSLLARRPRAINGTPSRKCHDEDNQFDLMVADSQGETLEEETHHKWWLSWFVSVMIARVSFVANGFSRVVSRVFRREEDVVEEINHLDRDGNALVKRRRLLQECEPCARWILAPAFDERTEELGNVLRAVETLLYRLNSLERETATRIAESLSPALKGIDPPERLHDDTEDLPTPPPVKKINLFIEQLYETRTAIYDAGKLAQLRSNFPQGIPETVDFGLTTTEKDRLSSVKRALASPLLLPALRDCQEASQLNMELHGLTALSVKTLHKLVLDMEAIDADMVPPTFVLEDNHFENLKQMFASSLHIPSDEPSTPNQDAMPRIFAEGPAAATAVAAIPPTTTSSPFRTPVSHDESSHVHGPQQSQRNSISSLSSTSRSHDDAINADASKRSLRDSTSPSSRTSRPHDDAPYVHNTQSQRNAPLTSPPSRSHDSGDVSLDGAPQTQPQKSPPSHSHLTSSLTDDDADDDTDAQAPQQQGSIASAVFTTDDECDASKDSTSPPGSSSSQVGASTSSSPSPRSAVPSSSHAIPNPSVSDESDNSSTSSPTMPPAIDVSQGLTNFSHDYRPWISLAFGTRRTTSSRGSPGNQDNSGSQDASSNPASPAKLHVSGNPGVPSARRQNRVSSLPPYMRVMPPSGENKTSRLRNYYIALREHRVRGDYSQLSLPHYRPDNQHLTDLAGPGEPGYSRGTAIYRSILRSRNRPRVQRRQVRTVRFAEGTFSPSSRLRSDGDMVSSRDSSPEQAPPSPPSLRPIRYRGPHQVNVDIDAARSLIDDIFNEPSALFISRDSGSAIQAEKEREAREAEEAARLVAEAARAAEEAARQAAEEQAQRELQARLERTHGLRLPEKSIVEPLSDEWVRRAEATLHAGPTTSLATTSEGIELRRHDFAKVVPSTEWLNDEIVNGTLAWLDRAINSAAGIKNTRANTRKCLAMSSFFWKQLAERGVERTARALRRSHVDKNNFLDVDTILLPVCENAHWTLVIVRPSHRTIAHMDSLNPAGSVSKTNLAVTWVKHILEDKYVADEWKVVRHEAPRQTNGWDCGIHTITNAICVSLGLNAIDSYRSEDMPLQRIRIACVLLNQGFTNDFDLRVN